MKGLARDILSAVLSAVLFLLLYLAARWNFLIAAVLAIGLFFAVSFLLRPRKKIGTHFVDKLDNGEELQALLDEARAHLKSISGCAAGIHEADVYENAKKLYATGENILKYLEANPDKIPVAKRFINYHLETADNLLNKYVNFKSTNLRTEDMQRVFELTSHALITLRDAFEAQYEKLMRNDLMDVEADIKVIETLFKTEGIL